MQFQALSLICLDTQCPVLAELIKLSVRVWDVFSSGTKSKNNSTFLSGKEEVSRNLVTYLKLYSPMFTNTKISNLNICFTVLNYFLRFQNCKFNNFIYEFNSCRRPSGKFYFRLALIGVKNLKLQPKKETAKEKKWWRFPEV